MTNDECDIMLVVAARPGRRILVSDLKKTRADARLLPSLIREKHLLYFEGGWVAMTDGGYDTMTRHCARNF